MNLLLLRLIFPLYFRPKNRAKRNIHPSRRAFSLDFLNETKKGSRLQSLWFNSPAWGETNASPQITYLTHTHNLIYCPPPFFFPLLPLTVRSRDSSCSLQSLICSILILSSQKQKNTHKHINALGEELAAPNRVKGRIQTAPLVVLMWFWSGSTRAPVPVVDTG